jgi:hypothetical protein
MKTILKITVVILFFASILYSCLKEDMQNNDMALTQSSFAPCDSLKNVVWGDTLLVVPNSISTGIVRKGALKGKRYWQALISSDNLIPPSNFKNQKATNRVVVADTTLITNSSIFLVSRIK